MKTNTYDEMTTKELLQSILEAQVEADPRRIDNVPPVQFMDNVSRPSTRAGIESSIRMAQDALKELEAEYSTRIINGSLAIVPTGPHNVVLAWAEVGKELGGTFLLAADGLYREIASQVEAGFSTHREFDPAAMGRMLRGLKEVGQSLDVAAMNGPKYEEAYLPTFNDTVAHVRKLIRQADGDELNLLYLQKKLTAEALRVNYAGSVVPVILLGVEGLSELNGLSPLFPKGITPVKLTSLEEVSQEQVLTVFKTAKQKIKKGKTE